MTLPLAGIRVLDTTRALAGPLTTMVLADLGADVVKVEMPGIGDETRYWGPPFAGNAGPTFLAFNRSKRSIALDLHTEEGRQICLDLARTSDVFVENFRPGTARRLGIGYEAIRAVRPDIVYCSISGYGQTGPMASRPAVDLMVQAVSGLMSLTGEPEGRPVKAAAPVSDVMGGLSAAIAILGALMARRDSGEGRHIDIAMLDATLALMGQAIAVWGMSGRAPGRHGNAHPLMAPYESFRTADGEVVIAVTNDKTWASFCDLEECRGLAADPRFATPQGRSENRAALIATVGAILRARPAADWLSDFERLGIPAEPINALPAILSHPHVAERRMLVDVTYPPGSGNSVRVCGMPWRDVCGDAGARNPPGLDQHGAEILAELYDSAGAAPRGGPACPAVDPPPAERSRAQGDRRAADEVHINTMRPVGAQR